MYAQEAICVSPSDKFSETPCMKVGLDVRISLVRVPSTEGKLPAPPRTKEVFAEKIKSYFKYRPCLMTIFK